MLPRPHELTRRDTVKLLAAGGGAALGLPREWTSLPALWAALGNAPATFYNRNIPGEAHTQMTRLAPRGISTFSFTPSNGWVITTPDGQRFARNIPDDCYQVLLAYLGAGHRVQVLAFPPAGGNSWVIVTDRGKFAKNIPTECNAKINEYRSAGRQIRCVAFPPAGGNRWVVVADGAWQARYIPDECFQVMRNLSQRPWPGTRPPRRIHHVAFTPSGGWTVQADDYMFARDVPGECDSRMEIFQSQNRRIDTVAFSPTGGWSIISNGSPRSVAADPIREFEATIRRGTVTETIWERMRWSNVPGVAVACVINNQLAWSTGYGHLRAGRDHAAHPESIFQAASISKVVAAIGVMALVRAGRFGLEDDLRDLLQWPRPIPVADGVNVTTPPPVQLALQHAAGFNHGSFDGCGSRDTIPTTSEILLGKFCPYTVGTNRDPVMIARDPGPNSWVYSGGGSQILQQLIEEQAGTPFIPWIKENVLEPYGMEDSFFDLTVPSAYFRANHVATGHDANGNPIGRNRYPESAAAGLYSTAEDLARMIIAINRLLARTYQGQTPIGTLQARQLMTNTIQPPNRFWRQGLGFRTNGNQAELEDSNFRYWHGGSNAGFKALFVGYPNRDGGAGVVVMTNGDARAMLLPNNRSDNGVNFRAAVANAVAAAYGW